MKLTAADKRWSKAVRERAGWSCQRCSKFYPEDRRQGIQAHHIFGRARRQTRLVIENGIALCTGCHRWAHANPLEFHEWARELLGAAAYDELRLRSSRTKVSA